jgi:3-deoxy-D-manno-octulosonate 8-phosphate phosphatase (KDO 8-P phosphatase)
MIDDAFREKVKKVRLLMLDVDGTFTNGWLMYDSNGNDIRCFDSQDGTGTLLLKAVGIDTVFVTIRPSKPIEKRAAELGMELYVAMPKDKVFHEIIRKYGVTPEEVCYVGDDVADLGIMKQIGVPIAVANAVRLVKEAAVYITEKQGGSGAVREVADLILDIQDKYREALEANLDPKLLKRRTASPPLRRSLRQR